MQRLLKVHSLLLVTILLLIIVFCSFLIFEFDEKILFGLIGIIVTFYFGINKTKIEDDKLFKELFRDFNLRYSALNESLHNITSSNKSIEELTFDEKDKIYDYFNLCAEEYYWYKKNRISKDVWNSWKYGMNYWYSKPIIKEMWESEIDNDQKISYYIKAGDDFFKD